MHTQKSKPVQRAKKHTSPHNAHQKRRMTTTPLRPSITTPHTRTTTRPAHHAPSAMLSRSTRPITTITTKSVLTTRPNTTMTTTTTPTTTPTRPHLAPFSTTTSPPPPPQLAQLFQTLERGLQGMLPVNEGMKINKTETTFEIVLGQELGSYQFGLDQNESHILKQHSYQTKGVEAPIVYMMSPISGGCYRYYYDAKRFHNWISIDDEHYMVEMLTRELLKKCYGCPMF